MSNKKKKKQQLPSAAGENIFRWEPNCGFYLQTLKILERARRELVSLLLMQSGMHSWESMGE